MTEGLENSIRPNPNGDWPQVDLTAYIDPTAQIIGNVHVGPEVFIGPNAIVRADETDDKGQVQPIEIEAQCNVQDGVIIHALGGTQVTVGHIHETFGRSKIDSKICCNSSCLWTDWLLRGHIIDTENKSVKKIEE